MSETGNEPEFVQVHIPASEERAWNEYRRSTTFKKVIDVFTERLVPFEAYDVLRSGPCKVAVPASDMESN